MCLALIAAILLFMLFYGLGPDSGISWLTIGIPVVIAFLLVQYALYIPLKV